MKISIIIPAYNEEKTIQETIEKVIKQKQVGEIIVVDDHSKDATLQILKNLQARSRIIKVISHTKNKGKGAAVRTALAVATEEYILIQDADLEYDPSEYKRLIDVATPEVAVYGSRILGKNPHAYSRTYFGNILITSICNLLFGTKLTDSYTCYKLIPTKIAKSLDLLSSGFELEAEITGKLAKRNVAIIEVPISYKPRKYEEGKKIKAKDALKGILTYVRIKFSI